MRYFIIGLFVGLYAMLLDYLYDYHIEILRVFSIVLLCVTAILIGIIFMKFLFIEL